MPWKIKDVEKHHKGLSDKKKRQWVAIANSAYESCLADGGEEGSCAASAIRQANGVVNANEEMETYTQTTSDYTINYRTYKGKKHMVVPIVMMVEGVHNGSHGPLLHKAEDLGRFPVTWNGIPIMIGHPTVEGVNVSANSPDILETSVGRVFHSYMDNSHLKGEAWLEENKLLDISPEAFTHIKEGKHLDVSVGVFTDEENTTGVYTNSEGKEEQYIAIAKNHRPDHLALLPGEVGACSWNDGCGVRTNKEGGGKEEKRKELGMSVSEFYAIPREPASESKLPIFDEAHVRNAMARFNQLTDVTDEEKEKAKKKILKKAKEFGIDASEFKEITGNAMNENDITLIRKHTEERLLEKIVDNKQGYQQLISAISSCVYALDDEESYNYVEEVFDDYVIYRKQRKNGSNDSGYYRQTYEVKEDGTVWLTGSPEQVSKKVSYEKITTMKRTIFNDNKEEGDSKMADEKKPCCLEKVVELIGNELTQFTEEDREWLLELGEEKLKKLTPKELPAVQVNVADYVERASIKTYEDVLALAPDDVKEQMQEGLKLHNEHRNDLIKEILENAEKDSWTEDELKAYSTKMLEKFAKQFKPVVDYSGQGAGGVLQKANENEEKLLPIDVK